MATIPQQIQQPSPPARLERPIPPLEAGDHLDQKTFHERYEAMPEGTRAELIGGIVYMPSPLKPRHGRMEPRVVLWLGEYQMATPGTDLLSNATDILGKDSEVQPDGMLIVIGGQVRENTTGYLEGPPEFIAEIASCSESYDLHSKKRDYERAGVQEYMVVALRQAKVFWFIRRGERFEDLAPGPDGILRSAAFPGLWLDPQALLQHDAARLIQVLRQGLASPEHQAFVDQLAPKQ